MRLTKRVKLLFGALFTLSAFGCAEQSEPEAYDYLIEGGLVFDGSGSEGQHLQVGIRGGQIVYVGGEAPAGAKVVVDASGLIVSPGFIDPHTHAYGERPEAGPDPLASYTTQGVTTLFSGNDGGGPVDIGQASKQLRERGLGANVGLFVGHGSVRRAVVGMENRPATDAEMEEMKALVAKAMQDGALGLSSGLFYAPGSFAETSELIELSKVAAEFGGIYESHLRDESNYTIGVLGAVEEAINIGRAANIPVHIAHIKALGVDVWGQSSAIIDMVEKAQSEGIDVTADQYPWLASGTRVSNALIPREKMAGGRDALFARLQNSDSLPEIKIAMLENLRRRGGPQSILLTSGDEAWKGLTLGSYAEKTGKSPIDAAVEIVLAGDAKIASFNMNNDDVQNFMRQPWVMSSSDGGDGHPRKYASFPEKYQSFVRDKKTLTLAEFIHRSSGLTADTFKLKGRGYIGEDMKADVLIFHPENYAPVATYEQPGLMSNGVEFLFVNGTLAINAGQLSEAVGGTFVAPSH